MKILPLISRFLPACVLRCAVRQCVVSALAMVGVLVVDSAYAQTVCAEVKIEIQESKS